MAALRGTAGDDAITPAGVSPGVTGGRPDPGVDTVYGSGGSDRIDGGGGSDTADYGELSLPVFITFDSATQNAVVAKGATGGTDTLLGGGWYRFFGTAGADRFDATPGGPSYVYAAVEAGAGDDTVDGGAGRGVELRYLSSPAGVSVDLAAGTAQDGWGGTDSLAGVWAVHGSAHADTIFGGAADETFWAGRGDDRLDGRGGFDRLSYFSLAGVTVALTGGGAGTATKILGYQPAGTDTFSGMEAVEGTAGGDTIIGTDAAGAATTLLRGDYGADRIEGRDNAANVTDYSGEFGGVVVNLETGAAVAASGVDRLVGVVAVRGSAAADTIIGGAGDDVLDGWGGDDRMAGGAGNDRFLVDAPGDVIFEVAGGGEDTVVSRAAGFYLHANVENLALAEGAGAGFGVGNALANKLQGNALGNLLIGGAGDDTIGAGAGADRLFGGDGVDSLLGGLGDDWAYGGADADTIQGGQGDDTLLGEAGGDLLDGGAGRDWMVGGEGGDLYRVDDAADVTVEFPGGGSDTVAAAVAGGGYYLLPGVEALVLLPGTVFGVGNALNNTLVGNAGANLLLGGAGDDSVVGAAGDDSVVGGDGRDTLTGGDGADWAYGGADGDAVSGGAGDDSLFGDGGGDVLAGEDGADWAYGGADADTLLGGAGDDALFGEADADSLGGGGGTDYLFGGEGADTLDGGAGVDAMDGGAGSDLFLVDSAGDVVVEAAGGGWDTVRADIAGGGYALAAGAEVEVLALEGTTVFGLGNGGANRLVGNAAVNLLDGGGGADTLDGGAGDDLLYGGAGPDLFLFTPGMGHDAVLDYAPEDRLDFSGFAHVVLTWLDAGHVRVNFQDAARGWLDQSVLLYGDFGGPGGFVLGGVDAHWADMLIDAGEASAYTQAGTLYAYGGVVLTGAHVGPDGGPGTFVLVPPSRFWFGGAGSDATLVSVPYLAEPAPPVDVAAIEARLATLTDVDGTGDLHLIA